MSEEEKREAYREAVREAIDQWLEKKYAEFGKWTLKGVLAAVFVVIVVWLANHGWLHT